MHSRSDPSLVLWVNWPDQAQLYESLTIIILITRSKWWCMKRNCSDGGLNPIWFFSVATVHMRKNKEDKLERESYRKIKLQKLKWNSKKWQVKQWKEKGLFSFIIMLISWLDCLQEKARNGNAEKCKMNQAYHLPTAAFGDLRFWNETAPK